MNFTATVLIASRIWYITGRGAVQNRAHLKLYWRIIIIIIESASFTAFVQIVQLGFYAAKFPGTYFVSDCAVQIVVSGLAERCRCSLRIHTLDYGSIDDHRTDWGDAQGSE